MEASLQADVLDGVPHGFSTAAGREGEDILPDAPRVRLKQVHSNKALIATGPWQDPPEGDALVTDRRGVVLTIVTADCAPVLLADPIAAVIGSAHAGWRGAHAGILENTVAAMISLGARPERIRAAIGPTIAQASYEVDELFRKQFDVEDAHFFASGREGHYQFDLPAYVAKRLRDAGVEQVQDLEEDTYTQPDRFFSYRRATHRGENTTGRQSSLIGLAA
ncbi:peptidoglycan editing factor PgeF [Qipengyuania sp.]|uniref:peptidoglycan editing factor PgeF n=1 Tax=Qipengyuania sp. TaxID=2004515 RepID=UPI003BACD22C